MPAATVVTVFSAPFLGIGDTQTCRQHLRCLGYQTKDLLVRGYERVFRPEKDAGDNGGFIGLAEHHLTGRIGDQYLADLAVALAQQHDLVFFAFLRRVAGDLGAANAERRDRGAHFHGFGIVGRDIAADKNEHA